MRKIDFSQGIVLTTVSPVWLEKVYRHFHFCNHLPTDDWDYRYFYRFHGKKAYIERKPLDNLKVKAELVWQEA